MYNVVVFNGVVNEWHAAGRFPLKFRNISRAGQNWVAGRTRPAGRVLHVVDLKGCAGILQCHMVARINTTCIFMNDGEVSIYIRCIGSTLANQNITGPII